MPWFKGNLHSHTTQSDGVWTLQESVCAYQREGYHFLCISDHDYFLKTCPLDTANFLVLGGIEASSLLLDEKGHVKAIHHVGGIYMPECIEEKLPYPNGQKRSPKVYRQDWDTISTMQELVNELHQYGCLTMYNHPRYSRIDADGFYRCPADLLEVFNYNTVNECGEGYDETFWNLCIQHGNYIHGIASDDNHNGGLFKDSFGGYVVVHCSSLSRGNIGKALLTGHYYASSGLHIKDVYRREEKVVCHMEECDTVDVIVFGDVGSSFRLYGPFTTVTFALPAKPFRLVWHGKTGMAFSDVLHPHTFQEI